MSNGFKQLASNIFRKDNPGLLYIFIHVGCFLLFLIFIAINQLYGKSVLGPYWFAVEYLAVSADLSVFKTHVYTLLTYPFFEASFFNLLFNMIALYWIGAIFSDFTKPRQFHFVYLAGGIFAGLFYLLAYNLYPVKGHLAEVAFGSGATVMAIAAAAATLVPDYSLKLLFFGYVRLKYLVIALLITDIIFFSTSGATGSLIHLAGALAGFGYIKLLRSGTDLSAWMQRKPKLKVVKSSSYTSKNADVVDQKEIDALLDKISKSGYESLTRSEKARLFKASEK